MNEKKLVLIGGGGHCKSVLDSILCTDQYDKIVITDNKLPMGTKIMGAEVVGNDSKLPYLFDEGFTEAFITVGSIKDTILRNKLYINAAKIGFRFPTIIDSSAVVSQFASVAEGTFIGKNTIINADAVIGKMVIINTGAIVEHECMVGDFTHIAVGAVICGNVIIGRHTFIGAGSTVIQGIKIGNHAVIGAGSTVLTNIEDGSLVKGLVK